MSASGNKAIVHQSLTAFGSCRLVAALITRPGRAGGAVRCLRIQTFSKLSEGKYASGDDDAHRASLEIPREALPRLYAVVVGRCSAVSVENRRPGRAPKDLSLTWVGARLELRTWVGAISDDGPVLTHNIVLDDWARFQLEPLLVDGVGFITADPGLAYESWRADARASESVRQRLGVLQFPAIDSGMATSLQDAPSGPLSEGLKRAIYAIGMRQGLTPDQIGALQASWSPDLAKANIEAYNKGDTLAWRVAQ